MGMSKMMSLASELSLSLIDFSSIGPRRRNGKIHDKNETKLKRQKRKAIKKSRKANRK